MSLIVDSVKFVSLSDNVPIDDISFVKNNNNYFIFNKAHKKAYKLSGDTLDLLNNYDKVYNKIYGNVKISQNQQNTNMISEQTVDNTNSKKYNRENIIKKVAENLYNKFKSTLKINIMLVPETSLEKYFNENIEMELKNIIGDSTDYNSYVGTILTICKSLLANDKKPVVGVEKKDKNKRNVYTY